MLDIGFSEIGLIFVLGLIVLGPEKLPRVAAQVGRWIGRARGMARQFREQLEEEVNLEEARKSRPPPPVMTGTPTPALPSETITTIGHPPDSTQEPSSTAAPALAQVTAEAGAPGGSAGHAGIVDVSSAAAVDPVTQPEPEQQVYPDTYSHAHPTDSLGRAIEPSPTESPLGESGQQDWLSGTTTDKPTQTTPAAAYAPPHERGT